MNTHQQALQDQLQALRARYLRDLPDKLAHLRRIWSNAEASPPSPVVWKEIGHLAHALAGSGATFGCPDISELAREICTLCQDATCSPDAAGEAAQKRLEDLLLGLEDSCQKYTDRARKRRVPVIDHQKERPLPALHAPLLYMVDDDAVYAESLATHARAAHYRVHVLDNIEALHRKTKTKKPDAIIMDMVFSDNRLAGAEATSYFARTLGIPVIFLSFRGDIESRLAAVRAGASHYFVKPVEPARVITMLDQLTCKPGADRFHVMLVDDDVELLALYTQQLEAAGMQVTAWSTPLEVMDKLAECQPELIVLDVDMPDLNGLELAALIRHMDEYSHIPLVFLSADSTVQTRLASMHLGADDYLLKPIAPEFLVASLKARLTRARTLRNGQVGLQRAMRDLEFMQSALDEHAIVAVTDVEGRIVYGNHMLSEISGYSLPELLGQTHRIVKSGIHPPAVYEELWDTISSGRVWHGTLTNRAKDGSLYDVNTTIVPKLDEAGLPERYLSIRTDVTAIKALERDLEQEAERLSLALKATGSGIWEWNMSTNQTIYNASWRDLMGYGDADISWALLIHPDDLYMALESLMDHVRGETTVYASEHRMQNSRGTWDWVREVGNVVEFDHNGDAIRLVGTTQIINERVALEAQKQALQHKLIQAAKMESIGHLTAGVAHDFNNLLGGILGYTELSAEQVARTQGPEKLKDYLAQISTAGTRAKELIAQMLIFSRLSPETESGDAPVTLLQPVVKEVVHLLRSSIPSTIAINYQSGDTDLRARIQPVHLHQILLNLCINARDAVGEYGRIDVGLARRTVSCTCNACHASFNGDYAEISVCDTGAGIPDHLLTKIFDPFFTTKEVGKGTGMGLPVVHGIVHALDGHICVDSAAGRGTTLRILLPVTAQAAHTPHEVMPKPDSAAGVLSGLRIMVVDDEHAMASMLQELLSMHGAQVSEYTLPTEALAAFQHHPDGVDVLITDETMPGLSGLDMARAMLRLRPDLPILLCTGYSEHVNAEIARQNGIAGFMYKPVDIPSLLQWIQQHVVTSTAE